MTIKADKRELKGKKVKRYRREGKLPASAFGPDLGTLNILIDPREFKKTFEKYGYNKLFDLDVEGDKHKVLVKEVQVDPVLGEPLHASFYAVNMKKKLVVDVPVVITGESKAVKNNIGFLVTPVESLTVQCLPTNIPDKFEISIDGLLEVNDSISVSSIKLPENVEWDSSVSEDTVLATIAPPQKEIVEEVVEEEIEEAEEGEEGAEESLEGVESEKAEGEPKE